MIPEYGFRITHLYKETAWPASSPTPTPRSSWFPSIWLGIWALGVLCLVLLVGEKAMVDEIGREYGSPSGATGEWVILYVFLAIQLLYNILIPRRLCVTCQPGLIENRA